MTVERDPARALLRFEAHLGRCIGCGECAIACEKGAVTMVTRTDVGVREKRDLVWLGEYVDPLVTATGRVEAPQESARRILQPPPEGDARAQADARLLQRERARSLCGRTLSVFVVSSGDCGACALEVGATQDVWHDGARLGIRIVGTPVHADLILVTGTLTRAGVSALRAAYEIMSEPRLVVAIGACACDLGLFAGTLGVAGPVDRHVPVDVYVPGCPPEPASALHGLLLAVGRADQVLRGETWRDPRLRV